MNRPSSYAGMAALVFLLSSMSGWAQTDLGKRVSIDVNAVSPADVFRSLASTLGCEIVVDPEVKKPVTMRVADVTARTALNVICESIGCRYRLDGKRLVIEPLGQRTEDSKQFARINREQLLMSFEKPLPMGMRFENAPLSSVLEAVSNASEFEITVEQTLADSRITVDVSGQSIREALRRVLTLAGAEGVMLVGRHDGSKLKIKVMVRAKKQAVETHSLQPTDRGRPWRF